MAKSDSSKKKNQIQQNRIWVFYKNKIIIIGCQEFKQATQ